MKIKQKHISRHLGISQAMVSMVLTGKRPVSWPMAVRLAEMFPGKSLAQWKDAEPDDLRKAFTHIEGAA